MHSPPSTPGLSCRLLLPEAQDVARRIAECRDLEVALQVWSAHDLTSVGSDALDDLVDTLDVDEEEQAGLTRDCLVGHPRATDVSAAVVEGGPLAVVIANGPSEDGLIEARGLVHIIRGDVQVRDPAGPLEEGLDARILRNVARRVAAYFGCGVVRRYGFGALYPGKSSLASSSDTEPAMMTSSPCFQFAGVATL